MTNRLHLPTSVFSVLPQSPIVKILRRLFATFWVKKQVYRPTDLTLNLNSPINGDMTGICS